MSCDFRTSAESSIFILGIRYRSNVRTASKRSRTRGVKDLEHSFTFRALKAFITHLMTYKKICKLKRDSNWMISDWSPRQRDRMKQRAAVAVRLNTGRRSRFGLARWTGWSRIIYELKHEEIWRPGRGRLFRDAMRLLIPCGNTPFVSNLIYCNWLYNCKERNCIPERLDYLKQ